MRPPARLARKPAFEAIVGVTGGTERFDDFLTHLPAACAQRWADCGNEIGRIAAELALERADRVTNDALQRAAPAGVHRGDGSVPTISDQNRRAIGDAHAKGQRWIVADDAVRFRRRPGYAAALSRNGDRVSVHLADQP